MTESKGRFTGWFRGGVLLVVLGVALLGLSLVAEAQGPPPDRPPVSPPVGPPLSPPVGPPLSPPAGPPLSPPVGPPLSPPVGPPSTTPASSAGPLRTGAAFVVLLGLVATGFSASAGSDSPLEYRKRGRHLRRRR